MRLKNILSPQTIDKNTWVYLKGRKITLVHEVRDKDGTYHRTVQINISEAKIKKWFK
ncbi:hypothetical protein LCGC14_0434740 [marine sediment metagenome]|uniref:Uncharacterized protein n=1 Tax=marine sediment metagenome TaxID=412755 RepID=A0A0F9T536_9ZZZZ